MLRLEKISKTYQKKNLFGQLQAQVHALKDVNLTIQTGECLGLVGESGSGKSTLGKVILGLEQATDGKLYYKEQEVNDKLREELSRRRAFQIIFQDPSSAMNPHLSALSIVAEPLLLVYPKAEALKRARAILQEMGFRSADLSKKPNEFSGGQKQRIVLARAIALDPEFVVCDEPVSALDVSIQAQIINLLMRLQKDKHLTYLFISHDLAMVRSISQRVAVMYQGQLVEVAPTEAIFSNPQHAYTKRLLSAIPIADPRRAKERRMNEDDGELAPIQLGTKWLEIEPGHGVLV